MTQQSKQPRDPAAKDLRAEVQKELSAIRSDQQRELNRTLTLSWIVIVLILVVTYLIEVLKGERTSGYLLVFWATMLVPLVICLFHYRLHPDDSHYGTWVICGYFIMYAFVLITGSTTMVFSYILPILSFLVLMHRPRLVFFTGVAAMIVNIISVYLQIRAGDITLENSREGEIQLALILLCFAGAWLSSRMYDRTMRSNEEALARALQQEDRIHGLENTALTDGLTGLGNRAAYDLAAAETKQEGCCAGVIFCDVNGLKYCNDHQGHQAGDRLLQTAADKLRVHFRTSDCFRISGDEFVVLIPRLEESVFGARAKRFYEDVQRMDMPVVSVGWDHSEAGVNEAMKNAEIRMYEDKGKYYKRFPRFSRK